MLYPNTLFTPDFKYKHWLSLYHLFFISIINDYVEILYGIMPIVIHFGLYMITMRISNSKRIGDHQGNKKRPLKGGLFLNYN